MRRNRCAAILFLAAAVPLLAQEVDGRVLEDTSGEPLASAELRFHKAGMRELAADLETERDGKFHAAGLPPGEYTVDVSKPNHIPVTLHLRVPSSGISIRLVRYAVIAGTVRDTEGRPVPGRESLPGGRTGGSARVAVLVKQDGSLKPVRTVALEEGRYRIFDLPPGQYAVGLWWAGLSVGSGAQIYPTNSQPRFFDVAGGEEYRDIDFLVVSGASFSVSGKIEAPTPGMRFSVTLESPELPALPVGQLWTGDDGSFRLEKIPPGTYDLLVAGPTTGYTAFEAVLGKDPLYGRARIQVIGQNLEDITVPVSAGRSLDLVLRGSPESCPKTASVTMTLLEPWGLLSNGRTQANFDKPQTARDLAPARYSVSAGGLGAACYQVSPTVVDLNREPSGPVTLTLGAAGSIRGKLRGGATGFAVVLLDADSADNTPALLAFPDEQGRFEFAGLRPGRYRMAANAANARAVRDIAHMIEIDVPGGTPTEVELPVSKGGAQ